MEPEDIMNTLGKHFPGAQSEITLEDTPDRYNGHVLWDGFKGMSFLERQRQVFEVLNAAFGSETQRISMVFTYTPFEYEQLLAA